jgi:hypothetical protein
LEQEQELKLRFRSSELSLRLTDRLHAPNDDATFASTRLEVEQVFGQVYGASVSTERLPGSKEPLGLRIKTGAAPALEALLEKLGGPPDTAS